jgi:hypothetical protein
MEEAVALNAWGRRMRLKMPWWFWNLFGEQAVFSLSRRDPDASADGAQRAYK